MVERVQVAGPRGRLDVALDGPADGQVLLFHTGTPSGGTMFGPLVELGAERGLRHVVYFRPGYGGSERVAGRSVADCAADVTAIADALGIDRFYTAGGSGGGPHVLACAALLPERVMAAATIASVAPRSAEGLDWLAGMGEENLQEEAAAEAGGEQLLEFLAPFREQMMSATGSELYAVLGDLLSEVDRKALTGEYAEHIADSGRVGLAPGVYGWYDDDLAFIRDWGFDLQDITRPVTIWQGAQDRMVPSGHGEWLAAHVPGARARLLPDHGHLSISLALYGEILDDLMARAN